MANLNNRSFLYWAYMETSPGKKFRLAMESEHPLQVVGAVNAYTAILAKAVGFRALYLSGAGVANVSFGVPDSGITSLNDVLEDVIRITSAVDLPLLVDIDTGWGNEQTIVRSIKAMIRAGAAGVHLEDQVFSKRCGHLLGKELVSTEEMVHRIKSAVDARTDPAFVIIARTDALSVEGFPQTIERAIAYKKAGADVLFPEAFDKLTDYTAIKKAAGLPVLANLTEFGKTPLFTTQELATAGVDMALYPLSAARAMHAAALAVYKDIRANGTQKNSISQMQTRDELYKFLNYQRK